MSLSVGSVLAESSRRPTEELLEIKRGIKKALFTQRIFHGNLRICSGKT